MERHRFFLPVIIAAIGIMLSSCASSSSAPKPYVAFASSWHSGGTGPNPVRLEGVALAYHAQRLGVPDAVIHQYPFWWLMVGDLKNSGGWKYEITANDGVAFCLRPPKKTDMVTFAHQAPLLLLGLDSTEEPVFTGACIEPKNLNSNHEDTKSTKKNKSLKKYRAPPIR